MFKKKQIVGLTRSKQPLSQSCKRGRDRGKFPKMILSAALAASMLVPSVGCRFNQLAINEAILVSYRDMVWAKRAYNLRYGNCDRPYGEHFYNGFCAGYADVCNGGDGYVPALPPLSYRSSRFQSPDGAQCVSAWFEGYPAGVAAARQEKVGNFNNVMVSKMMNDALEAEKELSESKKAVNQVKSTGSNPPMIQRQGELKAPPVPQPQYDGRGMQYNTPPLSENNPLSSVLTPDVDWQMSQANMAGMEWSGKQPYRSGMGQAGSGSGTIR
jgi:hypothetical protein